MNKAISILALAFGFLLGVIAGPWLWPPELLRAFMDEAPAPQPIAALPAPEPEPPVQPPLPPEPAPAEQELVLKGVFVGGNASLALIAYGDETPRPYKRDDKLPDGSVLKAINSKDVEVEKNSETLTLPLERGTPAAGAEEPPSEEPEEVTEPPTEVPGSTAEEQPAVPPAEEVTEDSGEEDLPPDAPEPTAGEAVTAP